MSLLWLGVLAAVGQEIGGVQDDGDLGDLARVWRPEAQGGFGVQLRGEGHVADPFGVGAGLGLSVGLHERFAVSVAGALPAPGLDPLGVRVALPLGLVVPDESHGGFGLSVVPIGLVLGPGGFGGGGVLSAGFGRAGWQLAAHGGAAYGVPDGAPDANVGVYGLVGLGGHVELARTLAVRAEVSSEVGSAGIPLQGGVSVRGRYPSGLSWTVGGGVFVGADGALALRPAVGLGWAAGRSMDRDADGDGVVDRLDACWKDAESANGWMDEDGCPDELAAIKLLVMDLQGKPVAGAGYQAGDQSGLTDAQGLALLSGFRPETEPRIIVQARGFAPTSVVPLPLGEGENTQVVTLDWTPIPVRVRVRAADSGKPLVAHLRVKGPGNVESQDVDEKGEGVIRLRPGKWQVTVYLDRYQDAVFNLDINPAMEPSALDVSLMRAGLGRSKEELLSEVHFAPSADGTLDPLWGPMLDEVAHALALHPDTRVAVRVSGAPTSAGKPILDALVAREVARERLSLEAAPGSEARVGLFALPERPLVVPERVYFEAGSATIRLEDPSFALGPVLDAVANKLNTQPRRPVWVHGHATADELEPEKLANERAEAVIAALIARGVAADRLAPVAWAASAPAGVVGPESRRVSFSTRPVDDVAVVLSAESAPDPVVAAAKRALAGDLSLVVRGGPGADAVAEDAVRALAAAGLPAERVKRAPSPHAGQVVVSLWEPSPLEGVLQFAPGQSAPLAGSAPVVAGLVAELTAAPGRLAVITAYVPVDARKPEAPVDDKLATARAEALKAALVAAGVPAGQLVVGPARREQITFDPLRNEGESDKAFAERVELSRAASHRVGLDWVE